VSTPPIPRSPPRDEHSGAVVATLHPGAAVESGVVTVRAPAQGEVLQSLRWVILGLAVAATALNYVDRQLIALVKPLLQIEFHWSDLDYAHIVSGFQFAVAVACLFAGWAIDRIGLRYGYALAVGAWSLAGIAHAAATSVSGFVAARIALGVAEAGNTPAAIKAVATWFPLRERSLAVGFTNAGANIGAILTPLIVPILVAHVGWRGAFVLTGLAGLAWICAWLAVQRNSRIAAASREWAQTAPATDPARLPVTQLLRDRRTWAFAGAKALTDPVWWFFLFWFPDLLNRNYGLNLAGFGPPLAVVYLLACVGALGGGWLADRLIARRRNLNSARKTVLLLAALAVLPVPTALGVHNYWILTALVGLALAAHQCYSTNLFALAQDLFPASVVGSVIGIGATLGSLGGLVMLEVAGWVLTRTHQYWPMFLYSAGAYLAGLLLLHILVPRIGAPAAAARG
jgi:ACS family hexuronate transporter-like MFS transporter